MSGYAEDAMEMMQEYHKAKNRDPIKFYKKREPMSDQPIEAKCGKIFNGITYCHLLKGHEGIHEVLDVEPTPTDTQQEKCDLDRCKGTWECEDCACSCHNTNQSQSQTDSGPYKIEEGEKYPLFNEEVDVELIVTGPEIRQYGFSSAGCDAEGSGPASALELKNQLNIAFAQGQATLRAELEETNERKLVAEKRVVELRDKLKSAQEQLGRQSKK